MVFGELLSIHDTLNLAYFICWDPDSKLFLAQLNLNEKPEFYSNLLKPGIRVSCSLSKTSSGPDEICEVSSFEIVDIPVAAVKGVNVSGATVVHKDKVVNVIKLEMITETVTSGMWITSMTGIKISRVLYEKLLVKL